MTAHTHHHNAKTAEQEQDPPPHGHNHHEQDGKGHRHADHAVKEYDDHKNHEGHAEHDGHDHSGHIAVFKKRFWAGLAFGLPVVVLSPAIQEWFGYALAVPYASLIMATLAGTVYFYSGWPFLTGLKDEIANARPGMMTLIGFAISVAFFYSAAADLTGFGRPFYWELVTLVVVMDLGHWLEAKSVSAASGAMKELSKLLPSTAHRVEGDSTDDVPVSDLKEGDVIIIKPGESIPADGEVTDGRSGVNEAMVTGESAAATKQQGDRVIGGSVNQDGSLTVRVTGTGESGYLHKVMKMVQKAQESKSRTQNLADRAAAWLFYVAVTAGLLSFAVWYPLVGWEVSVKRTVSVLVIACPHALGLAIPLVVSLAFTINAQNGILIRRRSAFENLHRLGAVVFDKTGTLTEGRMTVDNLFTAEADEERLLRVAAGIEARSEHAIAAAITAYAKEKGIGPAKVQDVEATKGKGVTGSLEGRAVAAGTAAWMEERSVAVPGGLKEKVEGTGKTAVYVAEEGTLLGALTLGDTVRPEAKDAVRGLQENGIRVIMLTGDAEGPARQTAEELGIDDYLAGVLPEDKAKKIKEMKTDRYAVAMVGDGINDAPALAEADIGIAIGAGTDVAVESADLVLVKNNPRHVERAIHLGRATYRKMIQNLWWAAGYNIVAIPLAAGVAVPWGVSIPPAVGAGLMAASTVIVALNTQTLRRYLPG